MKGLRQAFFALLTVATVWQSGGAGISAQTARADIDSTELDSIEEVWDTVEVDSTLWDIDIAADSLEWTEDQLLRQCFKTIPDSLLPTLSHNNKLDMLDFMDSKMKAEVDNLLGGKSEMTLLTADSITVQVSEALKVSLLMLTPTEPIDSCKHVIALVRTYGADPKQQESTVAYYRPGWQRLSAEPKLSAKDRQRIDLLNVQTIAKWISKILKKD